MNEGIKKVENVVEYRHPLVEYLIIHQNPKGIEVPETLFREDINIIERDETGLSKSRNTGLDSCRTKYAVIADDDVRYFKDSFETILNKMENGNYDVLLFKIKTNPEEPEYKNYPRSDYTLNNGFKHWFSSIEIVIRTEAINKYNLRFDEKFGLGTKLKKGEEEVFISDCMKAGLRCGYINEYIVSHPYESTGKKKESMIEKEIFFGALDRRTSNFRISARRCLSYCIRPYYAIRDFVYLIGYLSHRR